MSHDLINKTTKKGLCRKFRGHFLRKEEKQMKKREKVYVRVKEVKKSFQDECLRGKKDSKNKEIRKIIKGINLGFHAFLSLS